MRGDERKPRLLMLCDRVRGGLESGNGVALFAPVVVRCRGELAVVYIFVAIQALCKGDFVARRSSRGNVALVAGHRRVFALQWITCRRVLLHAERAWLPAIHRVAGSHSPLSVRAANWPPWGSGVWQSAHCAKATGFLKFASV